MKRFYALFDITSTKVSYGNEVSIAKETALDSQDE